MSKEVALKKENEIVMAGFEDFADEGFEGASNSDYIISRVQALADTSAQVKPKNAKYIQGAQAGDICDMVLNRILAKGDRVESIEILPVTRTKQVLEWKPNQSGLANIHNLNGEFSDFCVHHGAQNPEKNKWFLPNGNEIIETWNLFAIDINRMIPIFLPFKSSGIPVFKTWITERNYDRFKSGASKGKRLPFFARSLFVSSAYTDRNGFQWFNWDLKDSPEYITEREGGSDLVELAKLLHTQITSGDYVAEHDDHNDDVGEADFR